MLSNNLFNVSKNNGESYEKLLSTFGTLCGDIEVCEVSGSAKSLVNQGGHCIGGDVSTRLLSFTDYLSERKDYGVIGERRLQPLQSNQPKVDKFPESPTEYGKGEKQRILDEMAQAHMTAATAANPRRYKLVNWSSGKSAATEPSWATDLWMTAALSLKVFLGGVPKYLSEVAMRSYLEAFGEVEVKLVAAGTPRGYGYATFRKESSLRAFLSSCQCTERRLTYTLPSAVDTRLETRVNKQVWIQVIPWMIANQQYLTCEKMLRETELKYTVFVGNLHGTTTARALYQAMASAFGGGVVYSAINVDYSKYPIGSGRVTFSNEKSYRIAVSAGYLRLCNGHSDKVIQIEPFLDDRMCQTCLQDIGKYFCRSQTPGCFRYFCTACWFNRHSFAFLTDDHIPLTKTKKGFTARANLVKQLPYVKQAETTPRLYCNKLF